MDLLRKTRVVSIFLVIVSFLLAVVLYLLFKILLLFIIVVPSLIYDFLRRREGDGSSPPDGTYHV